MNIGVCKPPYHLRPAGAPDFPAIKALIRSAGINPTGLAWQRFILAVDPQGKMIGCGQVKLHRDGTRELASIAVAPEWRDQGVARRIIERLLADYPGTLYLTCRERLGPLYEKFGFRAVAPEQMPGYYRRVFRIVAFLRRLGLLPENLLVMKLDRDRARAA